MPTLHTIEEMRQIAQKNNGECLSDHYISNKHHLKWHCFGCDRVWEATPGPILAGLWCGSCRKKIGLETAKKRSLENGFLYLDDHYVSKISTANFQCLKCGCKFISTYSKIIHSHFCKNCAKNNWIKRANEAAKKHGGKCLTTHDQLPDCFNAMHTKFKWKCKRDHVWGMKLSYVLNRNKWCDQCYETAPMGLIKINKMVKDYGGKCLSKKYLGTGQKLDFQCKYGHKFKLAPSNLYVRWCPHCGGASKSENIVKCYFEQIFDKPFIKIKPDWLLNANGNKMELDGCCEELGIAFEHNGTQHYEIVNKFKMKKKDLKIRKKDDLLKQKLCKKHNIKLFVIPALFEMTPLKDLYNLIYEQSKKFGLEIDCNKNIDMSLAFKPDDLGYLNVLKKIAKKHNGKILSTKYISSYFPIKCKCKLGHEFDSYAVNIKSGYWCPDCGGTKKKTIEELKEFVEKKGGKLLSKEYKNNREKLTWQCNKGHVWEANWRVIKRGHWCHECDKIRRGKFKLTIKKMKEVAEKKCGKCLSEEYLGSDQHLLWQCDKGHVWSAIPASIMSGRWCPICWKL